ncbi:MAG: hypothetical protein KGH58_02345 [Candidatus Micrarchaeota archaeon]|nr:hypothetical protein [Candidatus Micrarchaeota archaeon]
MAVYSCAVCKLHYESREMAERCYRWCSEHNACNLEITMHSIERMKRGR